MYSVDVNSIGIINLKPDELFLYLFLSSKKVLFKQKDFYIVRSIVSITLLLPPLALTLLGYQLNPLAKPSPLVCLYKNQELRPDLFYDAKRGVHLIPLIYQSHSLDLMFYVLGFCSLCVLHHENMN